MQNSVGFGQGDSAYYVGETPFQDKPKKTILKNLDGHENVLGFSGTNAKFVTIQDSVFYNNGVGVVPNTLDSERFEPNSDNVVKNNVIFWNNLNYFLPNSKVKGVGNGGLGTIEGVGEINYPTGVGVVLLGSQNTIVENNQIFGNFKAGAWTVSDPFNDGDNAISINNQWLNNQMGRDGTDTNKVDFYTDGAGSANCYSGNVSSTFDLSATMPTALLYPSCPAPAGTGGNGTSTGDGEQVGEEIQYVAANPPEKQQCSWAIHDHPPYKNYTPVLLEPGPTC
jgi:hypothetical protein